VDDARRTTADLLADLENLLQQRHPSDAGGTLEQIRNLPEQERNQALDAFLKRLQVVLGHRRMSKARVITLFDRN